MHVFVGRNSDLYTSYRFPQTALAVVAIWLADASGPVSEMRRHFIFTLTPAFVCAILVVTYACFFRWRGASPRASVGWALAGIFCTPNWYYGTSTYDDILGTTALVLAVTVAYMSKTRRPLLGATVVGLLMAWTVNCKQPLGLFLAPLLAALYRHDVSWRRQLRPIGIVVVGLVLGIVCYKAYDLYKFPPGSPEQNDEVVWTANPLPGLLGLTVSPLCGAIWYCPTLGLSIYGWWRWRNEERGFCRSILAASLGFLVFISFLTFFMGGPNWGPRYLTPVFALWWLFVPDAAAPLRSGLVKRLLLAGCLVQLLALSVEPQRLFFRLPVPIDYYVEQPWLVFHPRISHLLQRPAEIIEILTNPEPAPEYTTGRNATYATTLRPTWPSVVVGTLGTLAVPGGACPVATPATALTVNASHHWREQYQQATRHYQVFASLRPWWISQRYLARTDRPVDLAKTLELLGALALIGIGLMAGGYSLGRDAARSGGREGAVAPSRPPLS
jgi:hypothetical protein